MQGDPVYRHKLAKRLLLAFLIGGPALYYFHYSYEQFSSSKTPESLENLFFLIMIGYGIGTLISVYTGMCHLRTGIAVLKEKRYPPSCMLVPYDTVVRRGAEARAIGALLLFSSLVFLIIPMLKFFLYINAIDDIREMHQKIEELRRRSR